MKRLAGITLGIALSLSTWLEMAIPETLRVLKSEEVQVIEYHLREEGYRVRVETGVLEEENQERYAVLNCRTDGGQLAFTWRYQLNSASFKQRDSNGQQIK